MLSVAVLRLARHLVIALMVVWQAWDFADLNPNVRAPVASSLERLLVDLHPWGVQQVLGGGK